MNKQIVKHMQNNPGKFGGKLMMVLSQANIQSHVWHLQTKIYSQHIALNQFYDQIVGLTDALLETYQGLHDIRIDGNMDIKIDSKWEERKVKPFFKTLRSTLAKLGDEKYMDDGSLANHMDEIIGLVDKTIYLLTLKH